LIAEIIQDGFRKYNIASSIKNKKVS